MDDVGGARAATEARHRRVDVLQRRPNFSSSDQAEGKHSEAGDQPPAVLAAPHQHEVFLDEQGGGLQRLSGEAAAVIAAVSHGRRCIGVEFGEMRLGDVLQ